MYFAIDTNCLETILKDAVEFQAKVYEEAAKVVGTDATEVRFDDAAELKYLDQCIKETLRIFTLFPLTMRKTTEEVVLNGTTRLVISRALIEFENIIFTFSSADKRVIPANCQVMMALPGVHFDSRLYPDPFTWDPGNFAPEAIESRPKNSFVPFGIGPRSCIGQRTINHYGRRIRSG